MTYRLARVAALVVTTTGAACLAHAASTASVVAAPAGQVTVSAEDLAALRAQLQALQEAAASAPSPPVLAAAAEGAPALCVCVRAWGCRYSPTLRTFGPRLPCRVLLHMHGHHVWKLLHLLTSRGGGGVSLHMPARACLRA